MGDIFSLCLADIHAKQHSFEKAKALLDRPAHPPASSQPIQLYISTHVHGVRALISSHQGRSEGAVQQCQAGVQLAEQNLRLLESGGGACSGLPDQLQGPTRRTSSSCAGSRACSRLSQRGSAAGGRADTSASLALTWQVTVQLAELLIRQAECQRDAGDDGGAKTSLQAAKHACEHFAGADASEAFPLQTAAVLHQEGLLLLGSSQQVGWKSFPLPPSPSVLIKEQS